MPRESAIHLIANRVSLVCLFVFLELFDFVTFSVFSFLPRQPYKGVYETTDMHLHMPS